MQIIFGILAIFSALIWQLGGLYGASKSDFYISRGCNSKAWNSNKTLKEHIIENVSNSSTFTAPDSTEEFGTLYLGEKENKQYLYFETTSILQQSSKADNILHLFEKNSTGGKSVGKLKKENSTNLEICLIRDISKAKDKPTDYFLGIKGVNNTDTDVVAIASESKIEGLKNFSEIVKVENVIDYLVNPEFQDYGKEAAYTGLLNQEKYKFLSLKKNKFFCLREGTIEKETVSFNVGEANHVSQQTKAIFDRNILLQNIENNMDEKLTGGKVLYCWKEINNKIKVTEPDWGLVHYQNNSLEDNMNMLVFNKLGQKTYTVEKFNKILPLYLSSNKFILGIMRTETTESKNEIISIDTDTLEIQII